MSAFPDISSYKNSFLSSKFVLIVMAYCQEMRCNALFYKVFPVLAKNLYEYFWKTRISNKFYVVFFAFVAYFCNHIATLSIRLDYARCLQPVSICFSVFPPFYCQGLFSLSSYSSYQIACPIKVSYWYHDGCWNHSIFISGEPCKY